MSIDLLTKVSILFNKTMALDLVITRDLLTAIYTITKPM